MKRFTLLMLPVLLFGCGGGGGGGGSTVSHFGGNYAGPFTVAINGTAPAGFTPPASGTAAATVSTTGQLQVNYGNSYVLTGMLHNDGSVTSGVLSYPSGSGTQSLPAVVGWDQSGSETTVFASVQFTTTSGSATFSTALTPLP